MFKDRGPVSSLSQRSGTKPGVFTITMSLRAERAISSRIGSFREPDFIRLGQVAIKETSVHCSTLTQWWF